MPSNNVFALLQGQGIGNAEDVFACFLSQVVVVSLALSSQESGAGQGLSKFFVAVLCKDV